jgi:hypothetical protein
MAYFSNGSEGMCFDEECLECIHGEDPCPIAFVQSVYNYEACNNKTARAILDHLVKNDGTCAMKEMFPEHFKIDAHQEKLSFFFGDYKMDEMFIECILDIVDPRREMSPEAVVKLIEDVFKTTDNHKGENCPCCTGDGIGADESGWVKCQTCGGTGKLSISAEKPATDSPEPPTLEECQMEVQRKIWSGNAGDSFSITKCVYDFIVQRIKQGEE